MTDRQISPRRWNLFARELEDILVTRNLGLGLLDNRASIHREKVRRLLRSLVQPKSFPVLNADELKQVISAFGLTSDEELRLRAALLATAIEKMLMDRINQDDALLAAEQLLPLLIRTIEEHATSPEGLGAVKGFGEMDLSEEHEIDLTLNSALEAIDRATMELYLSHNVTLHAERVRCTRQARDSFKAALKELEEAKEDIQDTEVWNMWHTEAQRGLHSAKERLEDLGEES